MARWGTLYALPPRPIGRHRQGYVLSTGLPDAIERAHEGGCLDHRGFALDPASVFTTAGRRASQGVATLRAVGPFLPGAQVAVLDPKSPEIGFLYSPHVGPHTNVQIQHRPCTCGRLHAHVNATTDIPAHSILTAHRIDFTRTSMYVQFDGGCDRHLRVGGAGVALWQGSPVGQAHVAATRPLTPCQDAYEAEAEAAILAVEEAYTYALAIRANGGALDSIYIQGDNLAIVAYFAGYGRVRRASLASRFERAWDRISRLYSTITWEQVPRSANTVADRLAGEALRAARQMLLRGSHDAAACYVSLYDAPFEVRPPTAQLAADLGGLFADAERQRAWTGFHLRTTMQQLHEAAPAVVLPEPEPQHYNVIGRLVARLGDKHLLGMPGLL